MLEINASSFVPYTATFDIGKKRWMRAICAVSANRVQIVILFRLLTCTTVAYKRTESGTTALLLGAIAQLVRATDS